MNGLHELPLIIFTVLAQSVVGATLVLSLSQNEIKQKNTKLFILLVLMAAGFLASIMHLGSPLRAFNSLNRIGESMLSNEIASGSVFFAALGLYWLLTVSGKMPANLNKIWLIVTALLGLVFMYMMNQVYHISTVPTWNSSLTSYSFYLTVMTAGFCLGYALFRQAAWLRTVIVIGIFVIAILIVYQSLELAAIRSSVQNALDLVPDYMLLNMIRLCLLAAGAYLLFRTTPSLLYLAAILMIAAEMIGRILFYGLHMTVGTAVAG
ncbi:anaerobic dimethyl sulfoxide reductase subunit C (DMSO reductase anchor subunit) [Pasteurella testudinis DSM 23072]|uniref:Anaerobic dimethyl sulfoxide reductase subunit C (DMSO reductase anchor subunit) n=1 Tax=Pasteurella testudinis DSM 23072 TaxID=1122938 RepID=A0A1W1USD8_9PAST|nr:DmsC/YnfH family molybdoenzyme membrane anchor subunit [Pasteurella testudinis]SMB84058.1 anaerobic dimethyl sulfoxide reductase subunit C (DMSO reductase anchor subunit) [Pasteurella testudinis DSM 23072]SUB50917.1 anaerobic dimethyl sulfoxide reductase chain C [Pasteurella testudinis]